MRAVLLLPAWIALLCHAWQPAQAFVAYVPCACPELETLSRSVSAACATPAVAALPQMTASCALIAALVTKQTNVVRRTELPDVSNEQSPTARLQQYPAGAVMTDSGSEEYKVPAGAVMTDSGSEEYKVPARIQGSLSVSSSGYSSKARTLVADTKKERRVRRHLASSSADMVCSPSDKSTILESLQTHCAVRGCDWMAPSSERNVPRWFDKEYLTLVCSDATALAVPFNHTACPSMTQSCNVGIHLFGSHVQPMQASLLQQAATLIGMWQGNASVTLRGQWGPQGLLAVLQHAHKLRELDAGSVGITVLGDSLVGLSALQHLKLDDNQLTRLPKGVFRGLSNLLTIRLHNNKLTDIDDSAFDGLSALEYLNLGQNQLASLPRDVFQGVPALKELFVDTNKLTTIDATTFHGLSALEGLVLDKNLLTQLPRMLLQGLTAIKFLFLDRNKLTTIDARAFHGLSALEALNIGANRLTRVPESLFRGLSTLIWLAFDGNEVASIEATTFHDLSRLEKLDVSSNQLTSLPDGLFKGLSGLRQLNVANNRLGKFDTTSLENMSALQVLNLGYNPLTRLPGGVFVLPPQPFSVSVLWLGSTSISKLHLPANSKLKYLNLKDSRQLTDILIQPGSQVAAADVSGTAVRIECFPCESIGYQSLVARSMQHMTSLDLLRKCMGKERQYLDASSNSEARLEAVRESLTNVATSFLIGNKTWSQLPSYEPVRAEAVVLTLVDSPVQCSTETVHETVAQYAIQYINISDPYFLIGETEPLQKFKCVCVPGYYNHNGVCRKVVPFVASPGGITTIVLAVIAFVVVLGYGPIKRRLHRDRHNLEMQRGLLEYAETEVLALKRVWELDASDVTLVRRIDGDSEGAFGAVWRGDWDGMVVAVKVLRTGLLELDSSFADEFDREAEFLMRARHANVVRFFGAGRMPGGEPFVVLELVSRGSLRGLLRGDKSPQLDDALKQRLALDVARGMAYIHSLGALHRDLKSGNVLVTENWRGKVADFGSMRTLLASAASVRGKSRGGGSTLASSTVGSALNAREMTLTAGIGTPLYMALEVLRGDDYGEAADVWAFGVMVWELVEERSPDLLVEIGDNGGGPLLGRLLKCLETGKRLQLRSGAPAWAERVVSECTVASASKRPTFMALRAQLLLMVDESA